MSEKSVIELLKGSWLIIKRAIMVENSFTWI